MKEKSIKLRGLFPAPSVPFDRSLDIIEPEFCVHIASMGSIAGIGGVAVNGHQGEMLALSRRERQRVIELARRSLPAGRLVVSGVLSSSIPDMVDQVREARDAGADAVLVMPPFDYMPRRILARSWEAPYAFFAGIADKIDVPLVIFQYPHASGIWYDTETMVRLAGIDTVVGVKHAVRHLELYAEQYEALRGRISVLAARDAPGLLSKMMIGADGACIGISNIAAVHWAAFVSHCLDGRWSEAREVFMHRLMPLISHVWSERVPRRVTYSASTKEALVQLGVFSSARVRPPELDVNEAERNQIHAGLVKAGLLPRESGLR
jgi:4-hydroxy-tetrahydrodipicolinate synthase